MPDAQSRASTRPVDRPRVTASSAVPGADHARAHHQHVQLALGHPRECLGALRRSQCRCPHALPPVSVAPASPLPAVDPVHIPVPDSDRLPDFGHHQPPPVDNTSDSAQTARQSRISVIFTPSLTLRSPVLSTGLARLSRFGYWEGRPHAMPADLAVIGLGHFGLPARPGRRRRRHRRRSATTRPAPTAGSLTPAELRRMLAGGFRPTTNPAELGRVRTAVICAPTPLGADGAPRPHRGRRGRPHPGRPAAPAHHGDPGVAGPPGHDRGLPAPDPRRGLRAARGPRLPPRLLPQPRRPGQPRPTAPPTPPR